MKFFAAFLFFCTLLLATYGQRCYELDPADLMIANSWFNSLNPPQKSSVQTLLSNSNSPPQANQWCANTHLAVICDNAAGPCQVSTVKIDNLVTKLSKFPTQLSALPQLGQIDLSGNAITGTFPSELTLFPKLFSLSIAFNKLTGTLPSILATMSQLENLAVNENELTGTIPIEYAGWPKMASFSAKNNDLTGTVPTEFISWTGSILTFDVGGNQLTGTVPTEYAGWGSSLNSFSVGNNDLTGTLPEFEWPLVSRFFVNDNQLTGTLPPYANMMKKIRENTGDFYVSNNQLVGTIPYTYVPEDPENFMANNLFLLGTNNFCPRLDYSTWAWTDQDYVSGCDMCAHSLNNTDGNLLCTGPGESCFTDAALIAAEDFQCVVGNCPAIPEENDISWEESPAGTNDVNGECLNGKTGSPIRDCGADGQWQIVEGSCSAPLLVPYEVYAVTRTGDVTSTNSKMSIRFIGEHGQTAIVPYHETGFASGDIDNHTVYADISVGKVWSIEIHFENKNDYWQVDDIIVTHQGVDSHFKIRVAVRDDDILEDTFKIEVKTVNTEEGATAAKVYAVLGDDRGYQQNLNFGQAAPQDSLITRDLTGYNLNDITKVWLGHYSADAWEVEYVKITKRGEERIFYFPNPISRYNRPVLSNYQPQP